MEDKLTEDQAFQDRSKKKEEMLGERGPQVGNPQSKHYRRAEQAVAKGLSNWEVPGLFQR